VDQGTVKKSWGAKYYALAVTVLAHTFLLSVFAAVKLSQPKGATAGQTTAAVSVSRASILAERPAVTAKPKVVRWNRPEAAMKGTSILKSQIPNNNYQSTNDLRNSFVPNNDVVISPGRSERGESSTINEKPAGQVEFFDSPAVGRRICYVVDCSGSMQGLWGQVRAELCESIGQLQPDQYFNVIVFRAGSILDSGGGRLVRASERAKKEAYGFISVVQPRGATNASAALEHAINIRDGSGEGPSLIYFLTDGFELSEQGNLRFERQVETMLKNNSSRTQINTIGFWADERDCLLLASISKKSGGQFMLIRGTGEKR
jgi:Mg-chelatase subunit ChlD